MTEADVAGLCVGCTIESGSDASAIALGLVGIAISVISAGVSVWAVRASVRNHDALILREEFQPHRVSLDASLKVLSDKVEGLELSLQPNLTWSRIEQNFATEQADTQLAALSVLKEAKTLDDRSLFKEKWEPALKPIYKSIEKSWDEVDRTNLPEQLRRLAASEVISNTKYFVNQARTLIENGVKAPLARKRWISAD